MGENCQSSRDPNCTREKNINTSQPCTNLFAFRDFLQIKSFPHSSNAYSTFWRNPRNPRRAMAPPATFWGLAAPVKTGAFVGLRVAVTVPLAVLDADDGQIVIVPTEVA